MAYEPRDMSGNLFKNDKGGNDKRPDYRGDICINGEVYELAAWIKEGNKGKFMSLSAKPKEAEAPKPPPRQAASASGGSFDDEIPFSDPLSGRKALMV